MILNETIIDRLQKAKGSPIYPEYDIRYLGKWIEKYPQCFPKWMLKGCYKPIFNGELLRWEIYEKI